MDNDTLENSKLARLNSKFSPYRDSIVYALNMVAEWIGTQETSCRKLMAWEIMFAIIYSPDYSRMTHPYVTRKFINNPHISEVLFDTVRLLLKLVGNDRELLIYAFVMLLPDEGNLRMDKYLKRLDRKAIY